MFNLASNLNKTEHVLRVMVMGQDSSILGRSLELNNHVAMGAWDYGFSDQCLREKIILELPQLVVCYGTNTLNLLRQNAR